MTDKHGNKWYWGPPSIDEYLDEMGYDSGSHATYRYLMENWEEVTRVMTFPIRILRMGDDDRFMGFNMRIVDNNKDVYDIPARAVDVGVVPWMEQAHGPDMVGRAAVAISPRRRSWPRS